MPDLSLLFPFTFGDHKFVLYVSDIFLLCKFVHLYHFFEIPHTKAIMVFVFRSIHVAVTDRTTFFLWIIFTYMWYIRVCIHTHTRTHTHINESYFYISETLSIN